MRRCVFCEKPAQGHYSIHRDGMGKGPEVPLCNECGQDETPTCGEIWQRIKQTKRATDAKGSAK